MNREQLKAIFPGASPDFLAINSQPTGEADLHHEPAAPAPKLERNSGPGAMGSVQVQAKAGARFLIRVTSTRKRLLDDDNLCEKYLVDLCRYAGVLSGDSPATTRIEVCQEKCEPGQGESTKIEVFQIE